MNNELRSDQASLFPSEDKSSSQDEKRLLELFTLLDEDNRSRLLADLSMQVLIEASVAAVPSAEYPVMLPCYEDEANPDSFAREFLESLMPKLPLQEQLEDELWSDMLNDAWRDIPGAILGSNIQDNWLVEDLKAEIEFSMRHASRRFLVPSDKEFMHFIQQWRDNFGMALRRLKYSSRLAPSQDSDGCDSQNEDGAEDEQVETQFSLNGEDLFAVQVAKSVARQLLKHERTTKRQARALAKAIDGLETMPESTAGLCVDFGVNYRNGDSDFCEMSYLSFSISETSLRISKGGSVYDKSVGSDSYSESDWVISIDEEHCVGFSLYGVEDSVAEYLNLGAEIQAGDESDDE